jgi:hypothetical protein
LHGDNKQYNSSIDLAISVGEKLEAQEKKNSHIWEIALEHIRDKKYPQAIHRNFRI